MSIGLLCLVLLIVPLDCFRSFFRKNSASNKSSYRPQTRYQTALASNGSPAEDVNEIKWFTRRNTNKQSELSDGSFKKKQSRQGKDVSIIEIPLFPCDDYVAVPTTSGNFHFIESNALQMMDDLYNNDNNTSNDKLKLYGVVLQGEAKTSTSTNTSDKSSNNDDNNANKYLNTNMLTNDFGNDDNSLVLPYDLAEVGTMMENTHRDIMDDGSQCCYNICLQRFRILSIVQYYPYMIACVEYPFIDSDVEDDYKKQVEQLLHSTNNDNKTDGSNSRTNNDDNGNTHNDRNAAAAAYTSTSIATASSTSSSSSPLSLIELLDLELAVWNNLTDVIRLTHEYTNYQAAERGSISEVLINLAPPAATGNHTNISCSNNSSSIISTEETTTVVRDTNNNNNNNNNSDVNKYINNNDGSSHKYDVDYIQSRLTRISDFSFAVADIVAGSSEDQQLLLQCSQVTDRLTILCRKLNQSRLFLDSVLFEGVEAVVEVVKGEGYIISKPVKNKLQ